MALLRAQSKAALITGGSVRIGRAISLSLAAQGFDIALHYHRSKLDAMKLAQQIRLMGRCCEIFRCDLNSEQQVAKLINNVAKVFPKLNLLVNNASIFVPSTLEKQGLPMLEQHWSINFKAPFILSGEFARIYRRGQIINILDTKIIKNQTLHAGYLLSKKALHDLTKLSAVSFAPGIRVNAIAPGIILPPAGKDARYLRQRARKIPLKIIGKPQYITQALEFLINNEFITGQVIYVDGGEHLL